MKYQSIIPDEIQMDESIESMLPIGDARKFATDPRSIQLSLYFQAEAAAAKIIAGTKCEWLCLDGLTELTEDTACELIAFEGRGLSLNALPDITESVAEVLSTYTGELQLNKLTQISNRTADALSKHRGPLSLDGLTSLSEGAAQALVRHPDLCLCINADHSGQLPPEAVVPFRKAAKGTNWSCETVGRYLRYARKGWPPPMPRRAYDIANDDPTRWTLTSAIFQAMDGRETVEQLHDGWFFEMEVEEIAGFTVLLEESLTLPEREVVIASGKWPLLRVPDGVLLVGPAPGRNVRFDVSDDDKFEVRVGYHDRYAIVRVPPGCYSVGIHQHYNSYYTFELRNLRIDCHWDPAVESRRQRQEGIPRCPDYLPLELREDLPRDPIWMTTESREVHVGSLPGLRNNPECRFPVRFSKAIHRFPRAPVFDAGCIRRGWTETLP
ncbi:MAG: hypothetical protein MK102_06435 [Fuerstiella sp.]|nr:hypothetical protein [Fuerstiella sp.]